MAVPVGARQPRRAAAAAVPSAPRARDGSPALRCGRRDALERGDFDVALTLAGAAQGMIKRDGHHMFP
jgi:hypothetical protein